MFTSSMYGLDGWVPHSGGEEDPDFDLEKYRAEFAERLAAYHAEFQPEAEERLRVLREFVKANPVPNNENYLGFIEAYQADKYWLDDYCVRWYEFRGSEFSAYATAAYALRDREEEERRRQRDARRRKDWLAKKAEQRQAKKR